MTYAQDTFGVVMSPDDARRFRDRLIHEVYPELSSYLVDGGMEVLASNLRTDVESCWKRFDWRGDRSGAVAGGICKVVAGKTCCVRGQSYEKSYLGGIWDGLISLNRNPELVKLLAPRLGSEGLRDILFRSGVTTLTGRIRGRVGFAQARNTPFQGLAADGAKNALWNLTREGFRVVAFIHDEVIVELPDDADHTAEAIRIENIMNRSMKVVAGDVPVACEYALSRRWSKDAKAIFDDGRLVPWEDR